MARMGPSRVSACQEADTLSHKTLFQHFLPRYLKIPAVRAWLMDRSPTPTRFVSNLQSSMSYACMYFPPTSVPRGTAPYPMPKPFLDFGDFMLCENVFDSIAVGTLYNRQEEHALAVLRDRMMPKSALSCCPRTRRFAVDLSVSNLEIIEFAWMEDDSLIIACRRLDQPIGKGLHPTNLVLSGDMLFYDIIPPHAVPGVPVLRMTLSEKPAICQFCGTRGIKTCACPPAFKTRAPSTYSVPVPFSHAPFPENPLSIVPQGPLACMLATWESYTKRIFSINTTGSFFVHWYKRSKDLNGGMTLFLSPPHPVSYHFMCGTRNETMCLASAYVKRMKLCERAYSADCRLYNYLSRGSDVAMLMDKESTWPCADDVLTLENSNSGSDFSAFSPLSSYGSESVVEKVNVDSKAASSFIDYSSVRLDDSEGEGSFDAQNHDADGQEALQFSSRTTTMVTGHSAEPSSDDHMSRSPPMVGSNNPPKDILDGSNIATSATVAHNMSRHVKDKAFDARGAESQGTSNGSAPSSSPSAQRLTLSTTSRELQQYMTVDASNTPTCKECGSSFPKRGNLARHIQTVHLKLKPFQCEHCHASFGYKNHLKRHQAVHQRGSESKCHICNREFKGDVQLTRHMQQSHKQVLSESGGEQNAGQAEAKRIACDICGVSFSQKSNLSRHKLIHEGLRFVCPVCPNKTSFGQRYDLHRHIVRKHPGFSDTTFLSIAPERIEHNHRP